MLANTLGYLQGLQLQESYHKHSKVDYPWSNSVKVVMKLHTSLKKLSINDCFLIKPLYLSIHLSIYPYNFKYFVSFLLKKYSVGSNKVEHILFLAYAFNMLSLV